MSKSKYIIMFKFDSKQDRDEVMDTLTRYSTLSWYSDTKFSDLEVKKKEFTVEVSKSKLNTPKNFRL